MPTKLRVSAASACDRFCCAESCWRVVSSTSIRVPVRKQFDDQLFEALSSEEIAQLTLLLGMLNARLLALEEVK